LYWKSIFQKIFIAVIKRKYHLVLAGYIKLIKVDNFFFPQRKHIPEKFPGRDRTAPAVSFIKEFYIMITKYYRIKTGTVNLDRGNGDFYVFWKADDYSGPTFQDVFNNIFDPDRDYVLEFYIEFHVNLFPYLDLIGCQAMPELAVSFPAVSFTVWAKARVSTMPRKHRLFSSVKESTVSSSRFLFTSVGMIFHTFLQ
jgi:hypothetical protein